MAIMALFVESPALAQEVAGSRSVLVLDMTAQGVSAEVASQATDFMAEALQGREGLTVTTLADVRSMLSAEEQRSLVGCQEVSCLVDLTRGVKADMVLSGTVGKIGQSHTLSVTVVDAATSTASRRASVVFKTLQELPAKARAVAEEMFGAAPVAAAFKLPNRADKTFAVLDLAASGVTQEVAANLTQILSSEIKRVEGASVVSRQDIQAMLEMAATKAQLGCDDMSCLAEIGGALGVQRLVVGTVGRLAGSYVISLRLIAVQNARVENRITETFSGGEETLIRAVKHAGRTLLGITQAAPGSLAVSSSEEGARVTLDGKERGTLPGPPLAGITLGRHTVKVHKSGFYDFSTEVYVDPAETTVLWAPLKARPTPWYLRWYVWATAGGCVTTAVLATVMLVGAAVAAVFVGTRPERKGEASVTID
jgi:hypothetical protein